MHSVKPGLAHIPIDQIEIGSRFRKDYGDIGQLAFSIQKNGLITPIAVGIAANMSIPRETDLPYILLAGGRRMTALKHLEWKDVPCRTYDQNLTELDFRSIELAENFDRQDMSYAEDIAIKSEINALQIKLHGPKHSKSPDASGWSQADTAKLIKESPSTLARDLQLADAIKKFPDLHLDTCKNKAEALKRLKNVGKTLINSAAAATYTKEIGNTSKLFTKLSSSYIIGDCFKTIAKIPNSSLDFIEIDPPYGIDLCNTKRDNECIGYNEVNPDEYIAFMANIINESYRTLKENSWLVCWFAPDPWFQTLATIIQNAGFKMNLLPGEWTKPTGQTMQPETFLGNAYEMFFYARKGRPKLQKPGRSNIFQYSPVSAATKYHPTQRPIDLMVDLYSTFCAPGSNGYIPFLGSGVGLLAGHQCKINMIGNDLTSEFKDGYILQLKELLHV